MKFTGDEIELALIREFTKLAVDEAGGFPHSRARDQDDVDLGSVGEANFA